MYIQIVIILLFSNPKASRDIRDYFEWMQIYKLDFRFLNNIFNIQNNEIWYITDSEKLKAIHLYGQVDKLKINQIGWSSANIAFDCNKLSIILI